ADGLGQRQSGRYAGATGGPDAAGLPARYPRRRAARVPALPQSAGIARRACAARPGARSGANAGSGAVLRCAGRRGRARRYRGSGMAGAALGAGGTAGVAVRPGTGHARRLTEETGRAAGPVARLTAYLVRSTLARVP